MRHSKILTASVLPMLCPPPWQVAYIKQQLADQAPAPGKTVTAPCYQDIVGSYFLGTLCDLPPDSKADGNDRPADASTDDGGRRLLAALRWW